MHVSEGVSKRRMSHRCYLWRVLILIVEVDLTTVVGDLFSAHCVKAKGAYRIFVEHVTASGHFIHSASFDIWTFTSRSW